MIEISLNIDFYIDFVIKLIRYTKSKLVPIYVRSIFYFYKIKSRYALKNFCYLKQILKLKFYLDFFINKFRDYPYFIGRDIK